MILVGIGIFVYPFLMPHLSQFEVFETSHKVEEAYNMKMPTDGIATDIKNFVVTFPLIYKVRWNNPITPLFIAIIITATVYRIYSVIYYSIHPLSDNDEYKSRVSKDAIYFVSAVGIFFVINLVVWFIRYYVL